MQKSVITTNQLNNITRKNAFQIEANRINEELVRKANEAARTAAAAINAQVKAQAEASRIEAIEEAKAERFQKSVALSNALMGLATVLIFVIF